MTAEAPPRSKQAWDTKSVLRGAVALSVLLLIGGMTIKLVGHDHSAPAVSVTHLFDPPTFGDGLMAAGISVLAATPALRVIASAWLWARQRDWLFAAVGVAVLAVLAAAAILGKG